MSYELAMGFYRRSFYERCYQPSDAYTCTRVYIYIYIYLHGVTAADVSRAHIVETATTRTTRLLAGVVFLFWAMERISIPFSPRSLGSTHFPRVIASLFYELLNGARWITSRRGRISRSSNNKIIRLSRNYTSCPLSLSLSLVQFFVCPCFRSFQKGFARLANHPFSPPLPPSSLLFRPRVYYFFNVLFHQVCIVIRFVVYFASRVMSISRGEFLSPLGTRLCRNYNLQRI